MRLLALILQGILYLLFRKAGKDAERATRAEDELDATDDARAARDSLRDPGVRDELQEYRRRRDVLQALSTDPADRGDRPGD